MGSPRRAEVRAARLDCRTGHSRRAAAVALSGGIDSSLVGALCARALGAKRVQGLMLPETDSAADTLALSQAEYVDQVADHITRFSTAAIESLRGEVTT